VLIGDAIGIASPVLRACYLPRDGPAASICRSSCAANDSLWSDVVNWRVLRHLLIVFGAYFLAMELFPLIQGLQILTHVGEVTYRDGPIGATVANVIDEIPRAIVGVFAALLIWYALGPAPARRWMWGLASLFALFSLLGVRNTRWGRGPDLLHLTVAAILPAIACLLAGLVLQRLVPDGPGDEPVRDEPTPGKGRMIVLAAACSVIPFAVGGILGVMIAGTSSMPDAGLYVAAVLESGMKVQYAEAQFQEGKYDAAKIALEDFATYLERATPYERGKPWQPGQNPLLDAKGLAFDRMGAYARLAIIAERAQHADEASAYWARAEEQARVLDWKDPTRETIRHRLAVLMDYNGVKKQPPPQP